MLLNVNMKSMPNLKIYFKKSVAKRTIVCSVQSKIDCVQVVNTGFDITKSVFSLELVVRDVALGISDGLG